MLAELKLVLLTVRFTIVELFDHIMELLKVQVLHSVASVLKSVHAITQILQGNEFIQINPWVLSIRLQLVLNLLDLPLVIDERVSG